MIEEEFSFGQQQSEALKKKKPSYKRSTLRNDLLDIIQQSLCEFSLSL